jgi:serine/threonine protein kinase
MVEDKPMTTRSDFTTSTVSSDSHNRRLVENPNRKVTDYQLLKVIGTGTFGKVYLAVLKG